MDAVGSCGAAICRGCCAKCTSSGHRLGAFTRTKVQHPITGSRGLCGNIAPMVQQRGPGGVKCATVVPQGMRIATLWNGMRRKIHRDSNCKQFTINELCLSGVFGTRIANRGLPTRPPWRKINLHPCQK